MAYRFYREGLFGSFWQRDAVFLCVVGAIGTALWAGMPDGVLVILFLALLLSSVSNAGWMRRILNAQPLRWLGEISYSLYIFQFMPFMLLAGLAGPLGAYGINGIRFEFVAVLAAMGSGLLVHRCVELPARTSLRRLPSRIAAVTARRHVATPWLHLRTGGPE